MVLALGLGILTGLAPMVVGAVLLTLCALLVLYASLEAGVVVVLATTVLVSDEPSGLRWLQGAAALLLVGSWAARRLRGSPPPAPASAGVRVAVTALLGLGLVVAAGAVGDGPSGLVAGWSGLLALELVLIDSARRGWLRPRPLAAWYVAVLAVVVGLGLVVALTTEMPAWLSVGFVDSPHVRALVVAPALPLVLALVASDRHRIWWLLAGVGVVLAVVVAPSPALLVLLVVLAAAVATRQLRPQVAGVVLVVPATVGFLIASVVPGWTADRLAAAARELREVSAVWGRLADEAGRSLAEDPWTGRGAPGPHAAGSNGLGNTYLELATDLGLAGIAATALVLLVAALACGQCWRVRRDPLAAGLGQAFLAVVLAGCFVPLRHSLPLWLACAIAVGLAAALTSMRYAGPAEPVGWTRVRQAEGSAGRPGREAGQPTRRGELSMPV